MGSRKQGKVSGKKAAAFSGGSVHTFRFGVYNWKIVIPIAIVGISAFVFLLSRTDRDADDFVSNVACDTTIIVQASNEITTRDYAAITTTQAKIIATKGYSQDQNCLYILTRQALALNDYSQSKQYLSQLSSVYKNNVGYDNAFTIEALTPDQLKAEIEYQEANNAAFTEQTKEAQELDAYADSLDGGQE